MSAAGRDESNDEVLGEVSDQQEAQEESSTTSGPAAEGEYDPAQGSPGADHPVGEGFPDEAKGFDDGDRS